MIRHAMGNKGRNLVLPLHIVSAVMFGGGYYLRKRSVLPNLEFGTCEQYQGLATGLFLMGGAAFFAAVIIFFRIVRSNYMGKISDEE